MERDLILENHCGDIFRHFKGKLYLLITVAEHTEDGNEYVVYKALYGERKVYVRPKKMFLSKTDKNKHPKATQEYRFELFTEDDKSKKE